jgi:hypothetical protein
MLMIRAKSARKAATTLFVVRPGHPKQLQEFIRFFLSHRSYNFRVAARSIAVEELRWAKEQGVCAFFNFRK